MTSSLFDLTDRVAVVSGAANGMGKAMAVALATAGADLVFADIDTAGMTVTAEQISAMGRTALPIECDVSDPQAIDRLFKQVDSHFGRVDILGNVAGEGLRVDPFQLQTEEIQLTMERLVIGRFRMTQQAAQRMADGGRGSIMNIISIAGLTALGRGHLPYSMAMGAVAQMTRELSTEWGHLNIRVNGIVCAQVSNPKLQERIDTDPKLEAAYLRGIPLGRLGRPEDIQGLAVFLASDASAWITGALIPLDGGNLAKNASGSHPGMPDNPIADHQATHDHNSARRAPSR